MKNLGSTVFESFCEIDFECRKGARFPGNLFWLRRYLHKKISRFGYITLYIFLGTCDLTKLIYVTEGNGNNTRRKRYIDLRHSTDTSAVNYLRDQIDKFFPFVSGFPTVSIVFLELPPYSINEWNRAQGHQDPGKFNESNSKLNERISLVNVESPVFSKDLKRGRKTKGDRHRRYSLFFY